MTDDNTPNPANVAKLTQEIVQILATEDSVTRRRAIQAALTVLGEVPISTTEAPQGDAGSSDSDPHGSTAAFFARDGELKRSDTAFLCAAYHYSKYGPIPFTVDEIRGIAAEAGEIIPDRVDVTLRGAAKKGKKLFQQVSKGTFKPTASAAAFFK